MQELIEFEFDWYQKLINDLKLLNFEGIVKTKHAVGKRILEDILKFKRAEYGNHTIENLANDLEIDLSDLKRCIKFAKKYPELEKVTDGHQLSWNYIRKYLLPEKPHISQSTGETEWNTPIEIIESARKLMGSIDIDPASNEQAQEIIRAKIYYTKETNGLDKIWNGNVWLNPPYSQPLIKEFCFTLIEKYKSGEINQACILINNATETEFVQEIFKICKAVCFIKRRVKFIDKNGESTGSPLQGQILIYLGNESDKFKRIFSKYGEILWKEGK